MTLSPTHYAQSDVITLQVGKHPKTRFYVHKDLLVRSKFFAGCLNNFREAGSRIIDLEEDDPQVVVHFVEWLYTGKCPISHGLKDLENQVGCADIYAFGDKTCTEAYCNDIMDAWMQHLVEIRGYVSPNLLACAYRYGLRESKLVKLGLMSAVHEALVNPQNFKREENCYDTDWFTVPELMRDFTDQVLAFTSQPWGNPWHIDTCMFHEHKDGSPCSWPKKASVKDEGAE
jgi:BTB/POZ domain